MDNLLKSGTTKLEIDPCIMFLNMYDNKVM